ncbi:ORF1a polyprotein [Jasmine virus A-1]|nr:ORF1a polyprotein [Jasmine virus A-1]
MASFQSLTDGWNKIVNRHITFTTTLPTTTYHDVTKIYLRLSRVLKKTSCKSRTGKIPFKGRLSMLPYTPAELERTSDDRFFLIPRRRYVDKAYLAKLRLFFNIPLCRFKRMPVPILRRFGRNFSSLFFFINSFSSTQVGSLPSTESLVTSTHVGLTSFGDGFKLNHLESKNIVDLFLCFGRRFELDCDVKFRLQFVYNKEKKRQDCFVLSALCNSVGGAQKWADQFRLFDRVSSLQFSVQCLLLSIVERSSRLALLCNYRVNQVFRNPVAKIRRFMISECRGYKKSCLLAAKRSAMPLVGSDVTSDRTNRVYSRVDWFRCADGSEGFTVVYSDGKEVSVTNDRFVVRKLFNLTLSKRKFFIHPQAFVPGGGRFSSKGNEYCWLKAFAMAGKKIPDWVVPFPTVTPAMLMSCGLGPVLVGRLHLVAPGKAHFFVKRRPGRSLVPADARVGVKLNDEAAISMKNIDVFFDDICTGIVNQTSMRSENDVMTNVVRRVSDKINALSNRQKELSISVSLSSSEKKKLSSLFPDIILEFNDSSYSSHALFTALRDCENFLMAKRMRFDNFIDAGGDVVNYILKDAKNVHVCCPVIDVKDAQRHMTRSNLLDRMVGVSEKVTTCNNLCQNCDVRMSNIVAVEVYDMTLEDMAKSILKHGAKRFDFTMIIPPEIIAGDCDIKVFNDSLHVICNDGKVKYMYGDNGEAYLHDAEVLRDFLRIQVFVVNGVVFKKTLENSRECLHTFSLVPCFDFPNGNYKFYSHFKKSEHDKVLMFIPVRDKFGVIQNVKVKTDKSIVYHLLEYVMNTALRVDDKSLEYLISQFRARKSVSIKGGKVIQTPFDLPLDLYPGYLGVILGEGIRLREKTHYIAKMSYYKHYLPTVVSILFAYLHRCCTRAKQFIYNGILSALKFVMSEDFIEEIVNGDRRIFDIDEVFEFSQEVVVIGEAGNQQILNKSFSSFLDDSKLTTERIDRSVANFQERFKESEDEILRDLVCSGGGKSVDNTLFNSSTCEDSSVFDDIPSFDLFLRVRRTLSLLSKDESRIEKFTHIITKVIHYLVKSGRNVYRFLKSVTLELIAVFRGVGTSLSTRLKDLINRCIKLVDNKIFKINEDCITELMRQIERDEELQQVSDPDSKEHNLSFDSDGLQISEAPYFKELVCSGGGSARFFENTYKTFCRVWARLNQRLRYLREKLRQRFDEFIEIYTSATYIPSFLVHAIKQVYDVVYGWILSEDGLTLVIETVAFSVTNLLFLALTGRFSFGAVLLSSLILVALKISGVEKKYLGYGFVTSQLANIFSPLGNLGLITLPARYLFGKSVEQKMKVRLVKNERTRETASQLIAKDVLGIRYYDHISAFGLRSTICIALLICLWWPLLSFTLVTCSVLINDQKKYLNSIVLRANVAISFASQISRTIKSGRLMNFKKILKTKFDASKKKQDDEDFLGDEAVGATDEKILSNDDDVSVEFDYDGSYVETPKLTRTWASEASSESKTGEWESLNVSMLTPTAERAKLKCNVSFGLSDVILHFPLSANEVFVESGDLNRDSLSEYYYLESQKLCIELGKLDHLIRVYNSRTSKIKSFRDVVWDLRNNLDDATLYISANSKKWYRLRRGDTAHVSVDGRCKMTLDQELVEFTASIDGICVTSDELLGMFTNHRCLGLERLMDDDSNFPSVTPPSNVILYNKPPGAGKTTEIVNKLVLDVERRFKTLALTCTSAGKREIITKLREKGVVSPHKYVTTYDSVLMKGMNAVVSKLYCDEIFMEHVGQWLSCVNILKPEELYCYGDKNQIPFINRVPNTVCKFGATLYDRLHTVYDNISYRCPPDVCYILSNLKDSSGNKLYPTGVYSAGNNSSLLRSLFVEPVHGSEDIIIDEDEKYITFSQPEKDELCRVGSKRIAASFNANTVNEVQGGTFPVVNLVRLRQYDNPLYSNINQFIVAISRHTDRMCYKVLSSKLSDYVSTSIGALSTVSDFVIKEYKFKQRV